MLSWEPHDLQTDPCRIRVNILLACIILFSARAALQLGECTKSIFKNLPFIQICRQATLSISQRITRGNGEVSVQI